MSVKLVAIDIDGTLLNENNEITPRVKETIVEAKKRGIKVVLCTGRPILGIKNQLKELNLEEDGDYAITYNGSLVQSTSDGNVIVEYGLSYEDFLEIETMARRVGSHLHTTDRNAVYTANHHISPYTVHECYITGLPLYFRTVDEMGPDMKIIKMMMIDEPEHLDQCIAKIPKSFTDKFTTVKSTDFFFEILNKQAGKGAAVKKLAEHLNYTQDEVMAIGDNENDLSMLEYAGVSVAMENGVAIVKETAKFMTASNNADGVAVAIEKYAF